MTRVFLIIIIILLVLIVALVIFGSIQTVRIVKLQNNAERITSELQERRQALLKQKEINEKYEKRKKQIMNAKNIAELLRIVKEMQDEKDNNNITNN